MKEHKFAYYICIIAILWFSSIITFYSVEFVTDFSFLNLGTLLFNIFLSMFSVPFSFRVILKDTTSSTSEVEKRKTFVIHQ